jgi:N-acetylmuramoyl-L-alanine amidase
MIYRGCESMLLKKVPTILTCLLLLSSSLPSHTLRAKANSETVTITASDLNIREGPGLSYSVIGKVDSGESYSIYRQQEDWIEISLPGGKKGWVAEWFTVKQADSSVANQNKGPLSGTVTADNLRVRNGPGTSYPVLGSVSEEDQVTIMEMNGNWVKIEQAALEGWVSKEYVRLGNNQPNQPAQSNSLTKKAVATDKLNVRNSPSLSGNVIGQLAKDEQVTIHTTKSGWAKIDFNGGNAWVSSQYLTFEESVQQTLNQEPIGQAIVTATSLNIRDEAALGGKVIGSVRKGEIYNILDEQNNWLKLEYEPGKTGWAASWFFQKSPDSDETDSELSLNNHHVENQTVTILTEGTNIRSKAGLNADVIQRANKGEEFNVISVENDWYEIQLNNDKIGYVAGWVVSISGIANQIVRASAGTYAKNKTIIIDPGHGGKDVGTIGARGTLEKTITLETATLLYDKLKASGANVHMTRYSDTYVSLASRVSTSHTQNADAFVSLHYDSTLDNSAKGMTSYYYHDANLAKELHNAVMNRTNLTDRDARFGDYYVIRENKQNSALLELGFLSNPAEEMLVTSDQYQQTVAAGIFEGLTRYFKKN